MKRVELNTNSLRKKMTRVFNEFIRLRDARRGCISCVNGSVDHAGHYWPTSVYPQPSMRFCEDNVHGQCIKCNSFQEGNRQGYLTGLIRRYGNDIIESLDLIRSLKQSSWTGFEYKIMIKSYQQKILDLEKNNNERR